jgi:hypothetical protein
MLAGMAATLLERPRVMRQVIGLFDQVRAATLIHGGHRLIRDYEVARLYRDALLFTIGGDTSETQQRIASAHLCREPGWRQTSFT